MSLPIIRPFYISYTRKSKFSTKKKGNIILNALMCKRFNKSAKNREPPGSQTKRSRFWNTPAIV